METCTKAISFGKSTDCFAEFAPFVVSSSTLFTRLSVRARTFKAGPPKIASLTPATRIAKVEHGSVSLKDVERNESTWSTTDGTGMSDFGPVNPWTIELLIVAGILLLKRSIFAGLAMTHLRRMRNRTACVLLACQEDILDKQGRLRTCHQNTQGPPAMYGS